MGDLQLRRFPDCLARAAQRRPVAANCDGIPGSGAPGLLGSAKIGVPGEEDLFQFRASASGRHIIETGGQTDVVMKLFGPNSQTRLIAEDDDGGIGLNSKIATNLIPGQYFVQIRHFNKERGTGSYSVRVRR